MAEDKTSGNTPAANDKPQAPATGDQTPSQSGSQQPAGDQQGKEGEKVTLSKKEHDELQKKAAQTSEAQKRADTLQQLLDRKGKRKVEDVPPTFDQKEILTATSALSARILASADYQKIVAGNKLLAKVLSSRPWELLDTDEFIDAQDLVDQVLDVLDHMLLDNSGGNNPAASTDDTAKDDKPAPLPADSNPSGAATSPENKENQQKPGGLQTTTDKIAQGLLDRIRVK